MNMTVGQALAHELQYECASTRKYLEIVPLETNPNFKPHEKSMTLSALAGHVAEIPGWMKVTLDLDLFVMDTSQYTPYLPTERKELLARFDKDSAMAVEMLSAAPDSKLFANWTMRVDGKDFLTQPRAVVIRSFILSHTVHHRAQLGVYLRMLNVPLPSIYGPTADFPSF